MAYASWSVVFGEQPSAAKWNILGTNDSSFNDGTGLPTGTCVQIAQNVTSAVATGTTLIPFDDTIPQITEGDQYMTQAITPRSATNLLVIQANVLGAPSISPGNLGVALFQDSTANALAAVLTTSPTATYVNTTTLVHTMAAGTTSSTTFRIRCGLSSAGTFTFNGSSGARIYGAITKSSLVIREYTT